MTLGNFVLWLAGVFPDHITHRVQRRGALDLLPDHDEIGAIGFRTAAGTEMALRQGMGDLLLCFSDEFSNVRAALIYLSDALPLRSRADGVERVLREVMDSFQRGLRLG